MILIRDLFLGAEKYGDFLESPERITTSVLADRLKRLEEEGLVTKEAYQISPVRYFYALTPMGHDLEPLMLAMFEWVKKYKKNVMRKPLTPTGRNIEPLRRAMSEWATKHKK